MNEIKKNELALLTKEAIQEVAELERQLTEAQKAEKEIKEMLLEAMKNAGIKKIDTPEILITYVEPTDRERFDSKKFRADNPDLYDEYVTMSKVKESIRIKVK